MNAGRLAHRGARGPVWGPDRPRISLLARLRAAWRALRHPPSTAALAADVVQVDRVELVKLLDQAFGVAGISAGWVVAAPLDELECLERTAQLAADLRREDWSLIEAGRWPS